MKSLSQIEPRTPVDAINTPGDASAQYIITQPGSYYLTGNITVATAKDGIDIFGNDVTLDLNGFEMTGADDSDGIVVNSTNVVVRNGTLRNWSAGVVDNINSACVLERVRVYGCVNSGFEFYDHCTFTGCVGTANGYAGIEFGNDCVVTGCLVSSNGTGIIGGWGCVLSDSQAIANSSFGFDLQDNFNISKCAADFNSAGFNLGNNGRIRDCMAYTNSGSGFVMLSGSSIRECTASGNSVSGIVVEGGDSVVTDNHCSANLTDGIGTIGTGNRIENNQTRNNGAYGIISNGGAGADVVVRNTSSGNGTGNYSPTTGTTFGPLQTPAAATSPWANF